VANKALTVDLAEHKTQRRDSFKMKKTECIKDRTHVPNGGGVIPVFISKIWRYAVLFALTSINYEANQGLFSLAGKICNVQLCKIGLLIFA
jgi:hypothetical protein